MKILKPGKVEMRKFTCENCGCVFVATNSELYDGCAICPQDGCGYTVDDSEPYEEPTPTQTDRERLDGIICDLLNRETISRECIVEHLIAHGVTFRGSADGEE